MNTKKVPTLTKLYTNNLNQIQKMLYKIILGIYNLKSLINVWWLKILTLFLFIHGGCMNIIVIQGSTIVPYAEAT